MDIKNLDLETLENKVSQNKARLNQLKTQDIQRLLKEDKRLQILIGIATLAELQDLISTDLDSYHVKQRQLQELLNKYTPRQRDREFLSQFNFIDDEDGQAL